MADRAEVLGIELWEKRIAVVQAWIMRAETRFENLATITDFFESPCADSLRQLSRRKSQSACLHSNIAVDPICFGTDR